MAKKVKENVSPLPPSKKVKTMRFVDALEMVIDGKKITRLEWSDESEYGFMMNSILSIHRGGKVHNWIVSEGDLLAVDWVVIQ